MSGENNQKGKPIFYNIWGWRYSKIALIFILLVFLAMISLDTCDSPYVVKQDPDEIKIIEK